MTMTATFPPPTGQPVSMLNVRVNAWVAVLNERYAALDHVTATTFELDPLRKYVRVVANYGGSRSVHAFYDPKTGDVYKAAGWHAPAKHVRFNLLDDESFARLIKGAEPYGRYLYLR